MTTVETPTAALPPPDQDRAFAALSKHPSWRLLRDYYEAMRAEKERELGRQLVEANTAADQRSLDRTYGFYRGVMDVFATVDKAEKTLLREPKGEQT